MEKKDLGKERMQGGKEISGEREGGKEGGRKGEDKGFQGKYVDTIFML